MNNYLSLPAMRLLKQEKTGWFATTYNFSLTEFDGSNIPKYAILSHRWGAKEITFKDLESGKAKTQAGYKKLQFCAKQAARDGLLYFWVDTCCIDKSSSAELSTAINSMFRWYQNATKCYVYLPDVFIYDSDHNQSTEYGWESAFRKSEWFTRGWTLQELIAPTEVEFFSVEGERLGDKKSLERQIHEATGISINALRGNPLSDFPYSERLLWAARRETTLEEDASYCLLGLLDINMPLVYGEGQKKAQDRLQRKIEKASKLMSFVSTGAPWIVPFERNARFIGRETQLAQLEQHLFAKGQYHEDCHYWTWWNWENTAGFGASLSDKATVQRLLHHVDTGNKHRKSSSGIP